MPTLPVGVLAPFNFQKWITDNEHLLRPPVSNKLVYENTGMVVQVIGGPSQRVDFHDDPAEEFFYQLKGDMVLKVFDRGKILDIPIREGEVFFAPAHLRHSPQRPAASVGLVVEGMRTPDQNDGFEWFCFGCGQLVHRVEIALRNLATDRPPLFAAFYNDTEKRTCRNCGQVHPGRDGNTSARASP